MAGPSSLSKRAAAGFDTPPALPYDCQVYVGPRGDELMVRSALWRPIGAAVAACAVAACAAEKAEEQRVDPNIEILDESFRAVLRSDSQLECIGEGFRFTEGPAWMPQGYLVFSDIPADTIHRWAPREGVGVFRAPSHNANGNTVDLEGRLVTCEHGSRRVTRTEPDGTVSVLASTYGGRRLNSPNDAVVKSDGTIWFTDPPYGIRPEQMEQPARYVFRLDPGAEEPVPVAEDFTYPNGLCFSPDERLLYVANSDIPVHHIRVFRVLADNTLEGGEVFCVVEPGVPDGIRCDADGRLYSTAQDGVQVFSSEGKLLGKIHTPETAANCTFGGPDGRTLFITATSRVWRVELAVAGAVVRRPRGNLSLPSAP